MDEIARKAVDEALRKIREGRASEGKEQKPQKDAEKKPQNAPEEEEKKGKTARSLILSEAEFEKQLQDFFLNKQRVRPPQKEVKFVEKKDPYKDKRVYVTCEITVHNMPSDFFDALLKETGQLPQSYIMGAERKRSLKNGIRLRICKDLSMRKRMPQHSLPGGRTDHSNCC